MNAPVTAIPVAPISAMTAAVSFPDEIRRRVQAEIAGDESLTQTQVAREAGVSAPALNQWLKAKYPGDVAALDEKLSRWLSTRRAAAELKPVLPIAPAWIETHTARRILDGLSWAQLAGDICVAFGGAGLGKSKAVERYAATNSSVWVVTSTPATASVGVALEEIAIALGLHDYPLHPARLQREILRRLRGTGGLLIIDEAQHLTIAALEAIRSLHDACGVGLALLGNAVVYARLSGGSRSDNFAQLFSRIGKRIALLKPDPRDVVAIAKGFNVEGKAELAVLQEIARRPGALRQVVKTLRLAAMYATGKVPPVDIGVDEIHAAYAELAGEGVNG